MQRRILLLDPGLRGGGGLPRELLHDDPAKLTAAIMRPDDRRRGVDGVLLHTVCDEIKNA